METPEVGNVPSIRGELNGNPCKILLDSGCGTYAPVGRPNSVRRIDRRDTDFRMRKAEFRRQGLQANPERPILAAAYGACAARKFFLPLPPSSDILPPVDSLAPLVVFRVRSLSGLKPFQAKRIF
jgi:hypothetical protein